MKIVIDKNIPYIQGVFEPYAKVIYLKGSAISGEDVKDADALIIRTRTKCNQDLLEKSKVCFIASATIGHDHIDSDYLQKRGIGWSNCPGCNSYSVQQYVASCLVTLSRRYKLDLSKLTLGVVGCGNIGKKVVFLAKKLGMKVLINDPPRAKGEANQGFVSLEKIKKQADIITIHTPLIRWGEYKTYHLIDFPFLQELKRESFLINTARGDIVDNKALCKALEQGKIAGAILDVWENEPDISYELLKQVTIATSHIAGYSVDGKATATKMAVWAVAKHFDLPLQEWFPTALPQFEFPMSSLSLHDKILQTYDVMKDDKLLRDKNENFESLRHNYRSRRDFSYFQAILND